MLAIGNISIFISAKGTENAKETPTFPDLSGQSGSCHMALWARSILEALSWSNIRRLLDVLGQTAVLTTGQKSKLASVKNGQYPTQFALSLQHKDLRLILSEADEVGVPMPATAAAQQMYTAALAKGIDADFSIMISFMKQLAGISEDEHLSIQ